MNHSQVTDLQVKLCLELNDDVILKRIPNVQTFKELREQCRQICNKADVDKAEKITIFYMDCDNDKVGVADDADLQMAYALALSADKKVKFLIELPNLKKVELAKSVSALPVEQVKPVPTEVKPIEEPVLEMPLVQE